MILNTHAALRNFISYRNFQESRSERTLITRNFTMSLVTFSCGRLRDPEEFTDEFHFRVVNFIFAFNFIFIINFIFAVRRNIFLEL